MSAEPLLALDGVACVRGGRLLFEGVDLTLGPGAAAVVRGPNGSGKSSLLRIAARLLPASVGRVTAARTSLADEGLALDARLPLIRALNFWARMDGGDAAAGMAAMALGDLADVPVRMLSTGQRRRAGLARVIASGARLWLLDEPANGLDAESCVAVEAAVAAHRAGGGAVFAATHQPLDLGHAHDVVLTS